MKKCIVISFFVASTLLTACNTVKGMGSDIKTTGEAISKSAEEAKHKL